jgi:hypothetical protein
MKPTASQLRIQKIKRLGYTNSCFAIPFAILGLLMYASSCTFLGTIKSLGILLMLGLYTNELFTVSKLKLQNLPNLNELKHKTNLLSLSQLGTLFIGIGIITVTFLTQDTIDIVKILYAEISKQSSLATVPPWEEFQHTAMGETLIKAITYANWISFLVSVSLLSLSQLIVAISYQKHKKLYEDEFFLDQQTKTELEENPKPKQTTILPARTWLP